MLQLVLSELQSVAQLSLYCHTLVQVQVEAEGLDLGLG